jgi:integrase
LLLNALLKSAEMTIVRQIPGLNLDSDLSVNLDSWEMSLAARNKRPATIDSYGIAVRQFDQFLAKHGMPRNVANIKRGHVEAYQSYLLKNFSQATAGIRHRSLKVFWKWLVEQGEIKISPMQNMERPTQDEKAKPVYTHEQVKQLLASIKRDGSFIGKRDYAILMLLASTGMRRSEIANLTTDYSSYENAEEGTNNRSDPPSGFIDWEQNVLQLHRTKGRKLRTLHIHPEVRKALLRWMKQRQSHSKNILPWLWLSLSGKVTKSEAGRFTTYGISQMMQRRCEMAGVPYLPPHSWRAMWVIRSREKGVSDASLVVNAGWSEKSAHQMLARYSRAEESELARAEEAEKGYGGSLI